MQRPLRWFAALSTGLVIGALLVVPVGSLESTSVAAGGEVTRASRRTTFLEGQGANALLALNIPLLASLAAVLPWPATRRRAADVGSAAIAAAFCVLSFPSVGAFFVPTALSLVSLAVWPRPQTVRFTARLTARQ